MSGQSPSPSSSNQRSLDSDSGTAQLHQAGQISLQLNQRTIQSVALWPGPSLSPCGPLSLGPTSPPDAAHSSDMPLSLTTNQPSLLPYVEDISDFLGGGSTPPGVQCSQGPEDNSVDSLFSSQGVSRLPPVSSIIKSKESPPPQGPPGSSHPQDTSHSHSQVSLEHLPHNLFSSRLLPPLIPSHSSEPQYDWSSPHHGESQLGKSMGSQLGLAVPSMFLKPQMDCQLNLKQEPESSGQFGSLAVFSQAPHTASTSHSSHSQPGPSSLSSPKSKRKSVAGPSGALGSGSKQHVCHLCGKVLATRNVYQLHMRSHSGEKPFSCDQCGHKFSQKTSLTRHIRSHTGERPFPCEVCGKRFADKERIKIHMRTHTGEKPFSCEVCGKRFSQKSTVKRHMSVHTGAKPFQCPTCGKGFANRGNLNAHSKTHGQASGHPGSSSSVT